MLLFVIIFNNKTVKSDLLARQQPLFCSIVSNFVSDLGRILGGRDILRLAAESSQQIAPHIQRQILTLGSSQHRAQHLTIVLGKFVQENEP